jgi:hypothetical protein
MYLYLIIFIILCFFGYTANNTAKSNKLELNKTKSDTFDYIQREDNLLNE